MMRNEPRRRGRRPTLHNVAISFYNSKLRDIPNLRKACCDRHVLDDTIDTWKAEQRAIDGLQSQIRGITRADIIFSLRVHWKLIDRKLQTENVIIWTADVDDGGEYDEKISNIVDRIRNSRKELESNKSGIVITTKLFDQWKDTVCKVNERVTQNITIENESKTTMLCTVNCNAANQCWNLEEGQRLQQL